MHEMHAVIYGKVQGVWFRAWTRDTARELGLTGWVRNMPDGCVEILVQGQEEALDAFLGRLWTGPPLARVTAVDWKRRKAEAVHEGFGVRG